MLKVIETFSGIGSQAQALKNIGIEHSIEAIVEWEIGAMYAYDIMHNGPQDLSPYRHHTKESLVKELSKYTLSGDGKEPLSERSLSAMGVLQLKSILCSIERNNNLVDITKVKAVDLPDADLLTYSFPCQDLSVSGHWHKNSGGINRDANNRSTLLWQIERILMEYKEADKPLPKFLLMENVSNILSSKHIENFREFQDFLQAYGYYNQVYTLDARNFGVPQSRKRTYMLSVLAKDEEEYSAVNDYFFFNNLENIVLDRENIRPLSDYLKLNYDNSVYRKEAIQSTPTWSPSREKIYENNVILAVDRKVEPNQYARTITTKQDRNPNSGIIKYEDEVLTPMNINYRNLTPRECFLLMGFEEEQFNLLIEHNIDLTEGKKILPLSRLVRMAGNSIVVQVLESIFKQINEIENND
ncbi:DNA (cytosine-5-)-methyltransferase [Macrococcus brunensis]|uniref:Cytosine-specific methyltransferase n=2 Tax=Macrococcus brunensis TaxID=198483 RepID=A0A4R6BFU4_9STAP|nr:DNA (cytosine-5-)-methyltransferase [Macrococcus brunensis]